MAEREGADNTTVSVRLPNDVREWVRDESHRLRMTRSKFVEEAVRTVMAARRSAGCPNDTDGDGNCGRPLCPHCGVQA